LLNYKRKKIKPTQLAKGIGLSDSWMTQIKKKEINLSVKNLLKIADFLGVEPNELMPGRKKIIEVQKLSLEDYFLMSIKDEVNKYMDKKYKNLLFF